jgi:cyclic-di-GMP phosphodiesterase TipF (flagellum assembly factor)
MRLGAIFVAVCMALIAASAGAVAFLWLGLNPTQSATLGGVVLAALVIYNLISHRLNIRSAVGVQLADLSRGNADMARQIAEIGRRLAAVEGRGGGHDRVRSGGTDPLAAEIGELGTLVKQLADTVAVHESKLSGVVSGASAVPSAPAGEQPMPLPPSPDLTETAAAATAESSPAGEAKTEAAAPLPAPPKISPAADRLAVIRAAIEANRIDLYLQPIVTLPQRKVRFYEAMTRLRTASNDILPAADFIAPAETAGLMPTVDNLVVFRCVQVVRRLLLKNREIGVFCNIAGATLTDSAIFPQLLDFLDANRAIASSLILEFTQKALRNAGPIENEALAALAERGFRFSLDNVTDLRFEPREMANRGIRFVKVPANLLLNRGGTATSDIHPADTANLLGRFGIELVADKIESEGLVVDLLDYEVKYGQGFLFSPPRPVRAEALQGIAERADVVVRESPPAEPGANGPAGNAGAEPVRAGNGARGLAQLARRI